MLKDKSTMGLAFAFLAGCGGASSETYDQVATGLSAVISDDNAGESQTFADLVLAARGDVPSGLTLQGGKLIGVRNGLNLEYELDGSDSSKVKLKWNGKVEGARYKFELERIGDLKITSIDDEDVRIEGTTSIKLKSDFKDRVADVRHKYDFDSTSKYDVIVRKADGVIVSGTVEHDVHAKQKADDGSEKVKTDLKLKVDVVFENAEIAELDVDGRYKYRLKLESGELDQTSD